jgi:uncharacterized membrane protein YphA (DoxX/SURF4 family)
MDSYIPLVSRFVVAAILASSGLGKWLNFKWFVDVFRSYKLTTENAAPKLAFGVAAMETVLSIALLSGSFLTATSATAIAMFICFTAAVGTKIAQGSFGTPCGCNAFWKKSPVGWQIISRNVGLTGLAYLAAIHVTRHSLLPTTVFVLSIALISVPLLWKTKPTQTGVVALQH